MTSGSEPTDGSAPGAGLTIRELAAATGVTAATLRTWETRHGYPRPERLPGGHRRYRDLDVAIVGDIERRRSAGQTLPVAIAAARARSERPESSVFAALRRRHPGLTARRVRKATLLALSRAIEDETCARADNPVLIAAFQQERFYHQSRARWDELARTARVAVVFAGPVLAAVGGRAVRVPIADDSPLRREWVLVCDAEDQFACVVGWEVPGQDGTADADRLFEVLWTVDPSVVRDAARICTALFPDVPETRGLAALMAEPVPRASADLARAQDLLVRTLGYLDRRDQRD